MPDPAGGRQRPGEAFDPFRDSVRTEVRERIHVQAEYAEVVPLLPVGGKTVPVMGYLGGKRPDDGGTDSRLAPAGSDHGTGELILGHRGAPAMPSVWPRASG